MKNDKNNISATGLVKNLREILYILSQILTLVKRPQTQTLRATIYEDPAGKFICCRFSDNHYEYNENLFHQRLFEFDYEVTSRGITMFGYRRYDQPGLHSYSCESWSHNHEESSTLKITQLPSGKYGPHCEIIRKHFANLAAWAWAVAC